MTNLLDKIGLGSVASLSNLRACVFSRVISGVKVLRAKPASAAGYKR